MVKQKIVDFANASDKGRVRENNEDYFAFYTLTENSILALVCDGMGGHNAGEIASREAVNAIYNCFKLYNGKNSLSEILNLAFIEANNHVYNLSRTNPNYYGMGTTAAVLLINNDIAYIANIGDSRIYLVRGSNIQQLTKDNSYVQQLLDNGLIKKEDAKNHPQRNVILKAIGINSIIEPEISEPMSVLKDDIFILCTDGLTEYLQDNEIKVIVKENKLKKAAEKMIALANKRGGKDNITVQIIKLKKGNPYKKTIIEKFHFIFYNIWFALAFFIVSIILFNNYFLDSNKIDNHNNLINVDSLKQVNHKNTTDTIDNKISDYSDKAKKLQSRAKDIEKKNLDTNNNDKINVKP